MLFFRDPQWEHGMMMENLRDYRAGFSSGMSGLDGDILSDEE